MLRSAISWLAAVTRLCTVVAIVCPSGWSEMVVWMPGSAWSRSKVTPGIRPVMLLELLVTWKAPGPLPTVMAASAAAVTVVRAPAPEKALVAMFNVLAAPEVVDWRESRYSLAPVVTALADMPSPAPFMALTTDCRLPLPVLTSVAVSEPTVRAPVNVARNGGAVGAVEGDGLVGGEVVQGVGHPVDGHDAVGAGDRGARGGREPEPGGGVAAGDLQRRGAALGGGSDHQVAGGIERRRQLASEAVCTAWAKLAGV